MIETDRITDENRRQAIIQLGKSFLASQENRTIICHALGIHPNQNVIALSRMDNRQLSLHYYDVEDNGFLVGAPIGEQVN